MKQRFALVFTVVLVLIMGVPIVASYVSSRQRTASADNEEPLKTVTEAASDEMADEVVQSAPNSDSEDKVTDGIADEAAQASAESVSEEKTNADQTTDEPTEYLAEEPSVPLPKYLDLLEINPFVSGWLKIDGSVINDPVVYTPGSQNYFLHRDIDGTPLEKGTFFIAINWRDGFHNTLIYGHNMKDGSGFGSLAKFADSKYGLSHNVIRFDTLYEEREYELLAAFYSQIDEDELETEGDREDRDKIIIRKSIERKKEEGVTITEDELTVKDLALDRDLGDKDIYREEKDEDNGRFRYYYYTDLADKADYDYYVENVKARALYDTGVDAHYGDDLLTLSTCSYHVKNGRFIVVAVRHNDQ